MSSIGIFPMDRTFQDYDQSLLDLEEQRRSMELLMKKMGQEWEISGAGIGWMGDISSTQANVPSVEARQELQTVITAAKLTAMSQQHTHNYCENTSPDFLQTLMNMNESLLNQSAADKEASSFLPKTYTDAYSVQLLATADLLRPSNVPRTPAKADSPKHIRTDPDLDSGLITEVITSPLLSTKQVDLPTSLSMSQAMMPTEIL